MKNFNLKYSQTNQNKVDVTKNNNPNQINVVDSSNPEQKSQEEQTLEETYKNSKLTKELTSLFNEYEKYKNIFTQAEEQFRTIAEKSPFFKSVPKAFKPCEIVSNMADTETTFDDISGIIEEYNKFYPKYEAAFNKLSDKYRQHYDYYIRKSEANLPQFVANINKYDSAQAEFNTKMKNVQLLQRRTQQFQLLAPDLQKFFSVCSLICATETRYNRFMKMYKIPDLRDWKALIQYYTYALALIKIMEPKAYQIFPKNVQYIKPYYKNLYFNFEEQLREIQIAPAKRYFGPPGK